ncbi:MAG TPA: thioredoxin-disulfide reductase [Candidatus Omnitrophica bacterium]|nr:thioredoxin-disulfide reductase [Candidatus Omnitrophota bacterium]
MRELIIVGAGPAGITAAVYAARKKIDFMLVTEDIGGQTLLSSDVENYTGYQFITGQDLVAKFEEHLKQFGVEAKTGEPAVRILQAKDGSFTVETKKAAYQAKAVIVASGRRPRWLDAAGEEALRNKGVSYCATCDGPLFSKKHVAVIGGGNSALDAALQMMHIATFVYLIDINPELGGDPIMREKVMAAANAKIFNSAVTKEIRGSQFVEGIRFEQNGVSRDLDVQGVFVEIGSIPNSDIIDFVAKNENGEIIIDNINSTNIAGIFAAGDVTDVPEKQIIVAAGEGAKAVLGVSRYLYKSGA